MIKINCETSKGGAVEFGKDAWASYAVATAGDLPPAELFYANVSLLGGKSVQMFVNRETGLLVVDIINKGGKSGTEIVRTHIDARERKTA